MNETRSRTALVTGASTGIGRATALALARAGFDLAIADLDANWLADVAAEAQGRKVVPLALELRSEDSIEQAVTQATDALGAIDLLVNNAGRPLQKPATEVTWAMHGPVPYVGKIMHMVINCDKMVGSQFEEGLAKLKALAEK